jgi:hypothetical protein
MMNVDDEGRKMKITGFSASPRKNGTEKTAIPPG